MGGGKEAKPQMVRLQVWDSYFPDPDGECIFDSVVDVRGRGNTFQPTFSGNLKRMELRGCLVFRFEGAGTPVGEPVSLSTMQLPINLTLIFSV